MTRRTSIVIAYFVGLVSLVSASFCVTVTLVSEDYSSVLRWAAIFVVFSAASFAIAALLGSRWQRVVAVVSAMPLVLIIAEIARRW